MDFALSIFAVAFAAFCVWLTVRIINRRERWAKWTLAAVVGVPVLYVVSFGPVCWWLAKPHEMPGYNGGTLHMIARDILPYAPREYWPMGWAAQNGPNWLHRSIQWYATRASRDAVNVPTDWNGDGFISLWSPDD
jgi:hypothetical protein